MKRYKHMAAMLSVSVLLTACGSNTHIAPTDADAAAGGAHTETMIDVAKLFSERDLSGEYDTLECERINLSDAGSVSDSESVTIDGGTVTITGEGNYMISGALRDGMLVVDADKTEKVQLILNEVSINSAASAAVYIKSADKVFVTLADGTENMLSNGGAFAAADDNYIDAVIFSKDDLTMNGGGRLTILSPAGHGVVCKNELVITNGSYDITAASHGLSGKDSVAIADGSFHIVAGKDGIQSQNAEDDTAGHVYIGGGTYTLNVGSDGISAVNEAAIAGGTVVIEKSTEGVEARIINISGGALTITSSDDGINATDKRQNSLEAPQGGRDAVQSDADIHISGGIVKIDAEGDGIDSNGYLTVSGGEIYVAGPSNSGNGALDYAGSAVISGGIVVAAGQSGMAQNFGQDSTQGSILVNTQRQNDAGSDIALYDDSGRELLAWTMDKSYNSVVISCPDITDGASYIVKTGNTDTEITMDGLIYGEGFGFGGSMKGGFDKRGERIGDKKNDFPNRERPAEPPERRK